MHPTAHTPAVSVTQPSALLGPRSRRSLPAAGGVLAALALSARGTAAAQVAAPAPGEEGAQSIEFPALSLSYSDAHGPGQLTIAPLSPDPATGGTPVTVTISQARGILGGPGVIRPLDAGGYLVAASVQGDAEALFIAGTLTRGDGAIGWRGHGRVTPSVANATSPTGPTAGGEWHVAEWPAIQPPRAQLGTTVRLEPGAGSSAGGTVALVALPDGETRFELHAEGLQPGASYSLQLRAGTPAQPSASFTQLAAVTADRRGRAGADGLVRFRETEPVALLDIAGGAHHLALAGAAGPAASGAIPQLQPLG